jgi:rhodanese-related sulfurtransferase
METKMIKKRLTAILIMLIFAAAMLSGCEAAGHAGYNARIGPQQAMQIMADNEYVIILDVRTLGEFNTGHIPDAVSLPIDEIEAAVARMIPNLGQIILIYCHSGMRSAEAAVMLVNMGYYNVFDFGGIIDWTGEIITTSH